MRYSLAHLILYSLFNNHRQTDSISLTLSDLTLAEEGNYSCRAESDVGIGEGTGMLDVTDPPPYIRPAVNVTVAPGDKAILDCVVESNVEYDMRWYRVSAYSGELSTPSIRGRWIKHVNNIPTMQFITGISKKYSVKIMLLH